MPLSKHIAALSHAIDASLALLEAEGARRDGAEGMLLRAIVLRRRRAHAVTRGWYRTCVQGATIPPRSRPRVGDGFASLIEADQRVLAAINRLLARTDLTDEHRTVLEKQRDEVDQALLTLNGMLRPR